jgi:hypothetical protein
MLLRATKAFFFFFFFSAKHAINSVPIKKNGHKENLHSR